MRVYLDVQATQHPLAAQRGLTRWVDGYAAALVRHHPDLLAGLGINPARPAPPARPGADVPRLPTTTTTAAALRACLRDGPIAYHVASPFEDVRPIDALLPPIVASAGLPLIATVFDLIPLEMPEIYLADRRVRRRYERRLMLLAQADLLLTISEDVRSTVIDRLDVAGDHVAVVGAAASAIFRPELPHDDSAGRIARDLPAITRPFVLAATGDDPRKNLERLVIAWSRLDHEVRASFQLVCAGPFGDGVVESVHELGASLGCAPDEIVVTGTVEDELLVACYQRARLFVFPSLCEGFGLAALEAASCDCPTITSDASAIPEVLRDRAAMFSPLDPDSIADAIDRALHDDDHRDHLLDVARAAARLHTWDAVAQRAAGAYRTLAADSSGWGNREPRMRVALIGPLEPDGSDDATFTQELVRHLEQRCDLDVIVTSGRIEGRPLDHRRFRTAALGRFLDPAAYDVVHDVTTRPLGRSPEEHARTILTPGAPAASA